MYPSTWPIPDWCEDPDIVKAVITQGDTESQQLRQDAYSRMQREVRLRIDELRAALTDGRIQAEGFRSDRKGPIEPIRPINWAPLTFDTPAPYRIDEQNSKIHPWTDIRLNMDDVMELWPSSGGLKPPTKPKGRKKWTAVDLAIDSLRKNNFDFTNSDRSIAMRVQSLMNGRYPSKEIPGDRSLRNYISELRNSGTLPLRK